MDQRQSDGDEDCVSVLEIQDLKLRNAQFNEVCGRVVHDLKGPLGIINRVCTGWCLMNLRRNRGVEYE